MKHMLLIILISFAGCSPIATYPPVETDMAVQFSDSAKEPVPTIMVKVLEYAHKHYGGMDTIVINLPTGVGHETYEIVAKRLGGAIPMTSVGQPAFHIVELRVRGFSADADIVFRSTTGQYEMATIRLESSIIDKWEVVDDRVWLVPEAREPVPNYTTGDALKSTETP